MANVTDKVTGIVQAQFDSALRLAEFNLDTLDKLATVQREWNRALYTDVGNAVRRAGAAKDVAGLYAGASPWQSAWEQSAAYARRFYEVMNAAQAELLRIVDQQVAEINRQVVITLDTAAQSVPAGSEGAVNAMRSALQAANSVYEAAVRVTRQATDAAQAGLSAAPHQPDAGSKAA